MEDEDALKREIRELFAQVKPKHRDQVLKALEGRTNHQRVEYLRGWVRAS